MTQNELDLSPSPTLQRLGRAYSILALLVFNLLLAFACLNLAILPFLPPQEEPLTFPDYVTGALGYGIDKLRPVYPHYDDTQIVRLLLETFNNLPLACDPDLIFVENYFKGHYLNVSHDSYRLVADQVPLRDSDSTYAIFVFGGSTTFGYGEADWQTIPSHLQEILRSISLSGDLPIAVFNFGQRSYYSLQERLLFQKLIQRGFKPDLAIFVDGLNDTHNIGVPRYACVNRDIVSNSLRCPTRGLCLPIARLVQDAVNPALRLEPVDLPPADDQGFNMRLIERWRDQWSRTQALARAEGIPALFVRQPVPGFAYDLDYHAFAVPSDVRIARSAYTYPLWEEALGSSPDFSYLDLAYMSQDRQEALYVDLVHYTAGFMRDIAQEIAYKVIDMLDEPTRHRLGLPRLDVDEPILRFGDSWSLMDWHRPADGLQACQSATLNTWWQPYALPTSADWHDAYLSVVLQNDQGVLLKREVLLASLRGSPDEQRLYPLAVTLDIPCDAAPGPYDVALAMSLCQPDSGALACAQQDAFTRDGGLGAYPYLTTVQVGRG
jgi:hypothetical protein